MDIAIDLSLLSKSSRIILGKNWSVRGAHDYQGFRLVLVREIPIDKNELMAQTKTVDFLYNKIIDEIKATPIYQELLYDSNLKIKELEEELKKYRAGSSDESTVQAERET